MVPSYTDPYLPLAPIYAYPIGRHVKLKNIMIETNKDQTRIISATLTDFGLAIKPDLKVGRKTADLTKVCCSEAFAPAPRPSASNVDANPSRSFTIELINSYYISL